MENIKTTVLNETILTIRKRNITLIKKIAKNNLKIRELQDELKNPKPIKPKGKWKGEGMSQKTIDKLNKVV